MTRFPRILSTLLALVLFLNMIPPVRAEEGDPGRLTLRASSDAVDHGKEVTVTLAASQSFTTVGAGITLAYDPAVLKPVAGVGTAPFSVSDPIEADAQNLLRVSFLPGEKPYTFAADQIIAVVTFEAVEPAESTAVTMTEAFVYDAALEPIALEPAQTLLLKVKPVPVSGITLSASRLKVEIGATRKLTASVFPDNATDKTVIWTSSDETVVTVDRGILNGIGEGTATITAKAGEFTCTCDITVAYPPDVDYVVRTPQEIEVAVGELITVPVTVENVAGIDRYNAYDITFAYDPSALRLTTEQLTDMTLTIGDGTVNVLRYGENLPIGTSPFSLTFQTMKNAQTRVRVTSARVDCSANAITEDTARATLETGETLVVAGRYTVELPDAFTGEEVVRPDDSYTFRARDPYYNYGFDASTMGGQPVTIRDNGDGTFTVDKVTGNLQIVTVMTGKTYTVTLGTDMTGNANAVYMTDHTLTLRKDSRYSYVVTATRNGEPYTGFTQDSQTGIITIPGGDITGDFVFTVEKTPQEEPDTPPGSTEYYSITFQGSGAEAAADNDTRVVSGSSYSFRLKDDDNYGYSVTCRIGTGEPVRLQPGADGSYTLSSVTADVVITVEKVSQLEISPYLTLNSEDGNGATVYLVLVRSTPPEGQINCFDNKPMYFSRNYAAWCTLTVETDPLDMETAQDRVSARAGQREELPVPNCDANGSGTIDINDAQLVYNMYNSRYSNFENVRRLLNADINGDRTVNVRDATAAVNAID